MVISISFIKFPQFEFSLLLAKMGRGFISSLGSPALSPISFTSDNKDTHWRSFDNSVDAMSFGFVATAILISMFLVLAIFERFLRPTDHGIPGGIEPRKHNYPSPKMSVYPNGVSVLMPGEQIPTFIAHPAPCPPEPVSCAILDHDSFSVSLPS